MRVRLRPSEASSWSEADTVDLSVSVEQMCQLNAIQLYLLGVTYDVNLCLAVVLHIDCERFLKTRVLLTEGQECLVWSCSALPIFGSKGYFESFGGIESE